MDRGPCFSRRHGIPQFVYKVDRWTSILQSESSARKDFPVDDRVEIGEPSREFEFFSVNRDGAIRGLPSLRGFRGEVLPPRREKPAHLRLLKLQETGHFPVIGMVHFMVLHATENPYQHVEEVNADIGGDSAGLADVPFPGGEIPIPPGGDVRQVDGELFPCRGLSDLLPQSHDGWMDPELEDVVDPLPRFPFQLGEGVEVPGVEDERFFADCIGADAQGKSHMCIVQVVGRADAGVVDALVASLPAQLFGMPVEPLKLGEEGNVVKETVHDADRIGFVQCGNQPVSGIPDGFHVARRNVAGRTNQSEVLYMDFHTTPLHKQFRGKQYALYDQHPEDTDTTNCLVDSYRKASIVRRKSPFTILRTSIGSR